MKLIGHKCGDGAMWPVVSAPIEFPDRLRLKIANFFPSISQLKGGELGLNISEKQ